MTPCVWKNCPKHSWTLSGSVLWPLPWGPCSHSFQTWWICEWIVSNGWLKPYSMGNPDLKSRGNPAEILSVIHMLLWDLKSQTFPPRLLLVCGGVCEDGYRREKKNQNCKLNSSVMLDLKSSEASRKFHRSSLIYFAVLNVAHKACVLGMLRFLKLASKVRLWCWGQRKSTKVCQARKPGG